MSRPPAPVRVVNAVGGRTGYFGPLGRLDAEAFLAAARRRTGLSDLGPDTTEAFGVLVDSLDREAGLTSFGRVVLGRMLRTFLAQRLRVVEALRCRPDLAAAPVRRPLFVVGYWRTGTTLLQNLLAQAHGARPLRGYEAFDPAAFVPGGRYQRRLRYALLLRGLWYLGPDVAKIHNEVSDGPTECLLLLTRSFTTLHLPMMVSVPSYERWLWEQDANAFAAVYELHRMQLQTLQADGPAGYWVLKSPAHLNTLESLLRVYPDAAVVQTHRDPAKVVASLSSLVAQGISLLAQEPEPYVVGRQVLERTTRTLDRVQRTRATVGDDRIIDVRYADLLADPIGVVDRILERFDYPRTAASRQHMRRWLADNPQGKHGTHRYSLQQFGLDPATVYQLTARYRQRFQIPTEN
ncbi:MAG TPA: sulfotransferase [Jiangellaceae bacterium]|nr:sulfotransferase [Jiangellaceae bacterium]